MAEQLLEQLKDIHLPDTPSYLPLSWLGIVFSIVLTLLVASLLFYAYRVFKRTRASKAALVKIRELKSIKTVKAEHIAQISIILRQVSLAYFPRKQVAGLTGIAWLNFLNNSGNTTAFTSEIGKLLLSAPYQKTTTADAKKLVLLIEKWVKQRG